LLATLAAISTVWGAERPLVVARELTKLHEELFRGTVGAALDHFGAARVRGELVLILPPHAAIAPARDLAGVLRELLVERQLPRKQAVKQVAKEFGVPSSDVYRVSLEIDLDEGKKGTA
jgi:16S rRNA (cytidine1402-2'-O)-methyltransferase